jgi:hypothetical protein
VIFVETHIFTKLLKELMNDDEYRAFQQFLATHPEAGKVKKAAVVYARCDGLWIHTVKAVVPG